MANGVAQLGYLVFQVSKLEAWESFATHVLGLSVSRRRADGALAFRMDSREQRILVEPGPADDLAVLGWQVDDEPALLALVEKLRAAGVEVKEGTAEEVADRRVARLFKYSDPGGIPSEIFYGGAIAAEPFSSSIMRSGFVAEEQGVGHLVVSAKDQSESRDFYCNLLGFRLSDSIVCDLHGYKVNIVFLHANARHHSLAFGQEQKKRLHHFMLETRSFDDVGLCFDRTLANGLRIMQTLGRHPNDRMFSFYAKTPSGFQFECGWGGRQVDDATWQPATYDHISEWGHHPPQVLVSPPPTTKPT